MSFFRALLNGFLAGGAVIAFVYLLDMFFTWVFGL